MYQLLTKKYKKLSEVTSMFEKSKYVIKCDDKTWDSYTRTIPRGQNINDALIFDLQKITVLSRKKQWDRE